MGHYFPHLLLVFLSPFTLLSPCITPQTNDISAAITTFRCITLLTQHGSVVKTLPDIHKVIWFQMLPLINTFGIDNNITIRKQAALRPILDSQLYFWLD